MKHVKKIIALALVAVSILAISIPAMATTRKWVACEPDVNFRKSPSTSANLIRRIPHGATVYEESISQINGVNWSKIHFSTEVGYVQTRFLNEGYSPVIHPTDAIEAFGSSNLVQSGTYLYMVKNLQMCLQQSGQSVSVTGVFNGATYNAVVAYQRAHGLTADGIVGQNTRNSLWGNYGSFLGINGYMQ